MVIEAKRDESYIRGERAVWRKLLRDALSALGYEEALPHRWVIERENAVAALREVCAAHGDNDWSEDLSLADVIDKHLGRHLD